MALHASDSGVSSESQIMNVGMCFNPKILPKASLLVHKGAY